MATSDSQAIKNALVTLLSGLTLDGEAAFVAVKDNPRGEFDGYPSVRVLPGEQDTEKGAIGQNDRTVVFIVRTHLPSTNDGSEFDRMYVLTDLILDALDEADFQNDLNPVGVTTYILNATRGDWYDANAQSGVLLLCDINVEVKYSKNL